MILPVILLDFPRVPRHVVLTRVLRRGRSNRMLSIRTWFIIAAVILLAGFTADYLSAPVEVRAQTVEEASAKLATAEREVHATAATTNAQARHLQQRLD